MVELLLPTNHKASISVCRTLIRHSGGLWMKKMIRRNP